MESKISPFLSRCNSAPWQNSSVINDMGNSVCFTQRILCGQNRKQVRDICGKYNIPQLSCNRNVKVSRRDYFGDEQVHLIIKTLSEDLPRQYEADMDWSVYADSVTFVDPVTKLRGLLLYRGMISTIRLLTSTVFEPSTILFRLLSIDEISAGGITLSKYSPLPFEADHEALAAVRTLWETTGTSRWGKKLFISGDDVFRIGKEGKIVSHESAWNEEPSSLWKGIKPF